MENKIAKSVIIDEQMQIIVNEIISEYGLHYKISRGELYELLGARFQTKKGSIIPSDYCYDRTNKGIIFNKKPRLFAFLGKGMYECLGDNFPYKTEKYRAFPGQPHGKTEIFRKNYEFSTLNGQKGEKIPF